MSHKTSKMFFVLSFFSLLMVFPVMGQTQPAATTGAAKMTENPNVDPKAVEIFQKMGKYLSEIPRLRFEITDTVDKLDKSGLMVQYSHRRTLCVQRPDKLRLDNEGDLRQESFYYNGENISFYNKKENIYSIIKAPKTIDEMIELLHKDYGVELPTGDLARSNLGVKAKELALTAIYAGIHNVDQYPCHHLAVSTKIADWQFWIDAGEKPVPRKIVVHYKGKEGIPQYSMIIKSMTEQNEFPKGFFEFQVPAGAEKVEFVPLAKVAGKEVKDAK